LLIDAGVIMSEGELVEQIGVIERVGSTANSTAIVLSELHPGLIYVGGPVDPETSSILFRRDPWIAAVRTLYGATHAIIVDRSVDGIVHVRDPWGLSGVGSANGTRATLLLSDFVVHWDCTGFNVVAPNARKKGG